MSLSKYILPLFLFVILATNHSYAQEDKKLPKEDPVQWEFYYKQISKDTIVLILDATITSGWYMPSRNALSILTDSLSLKAFDVSLRIFDTQKDNATYVGPLKASRIPYVYTNAGLDKELDMSCYRNKVRFVQVVHIEDPSKITYIQGFLFFNALRPFRNRLERAYPDGLNESFRLKFQKRKYPVVCAGFKHKRMREGN